MKSIGVSQGLTLEKKRPSSSADHELTRLKRDLLLKLGRGDDALEAAWAEFEAHPSKYSYCQRRSESRLNLAV